MRRSGGCHCQAGTTMTPTSATTATARPSDALTRESAARDVLLRAARAGHRGAARHPLPPEQGDRRSVSQPRPGRGVGRHRLRARANGRGAAAHPQHGRADDDGRAAAARSSCSTWPRAESNSRGRDLNIHIVTSSGASTRTNRSSSARSACSAIRSRSPPASRWARGCAAGISSPWPGSATARPAPARFTRG